MESCGQKLKAACMYGLMPMQPLQVTYLVMALHLSIFELAVFMCVAVKSPAVSVYQRPCHELIILTLMVPV